MPDYNNVVNLRGISTRGSLADEDRANPELIAGIEELLAEAKAGRLTGGLFVFSSTAGDHHTAIYARDISSVELMGISMLGLEMVGDFVRGV